MDRDEILRLKQITGLMSLFQDVDFGSSWVPVSEEDGVDDEDLSRLDSDDTLHGTTVCLP